MNKDLVDLVSHEKAPLFVMFHSPRLMEKMFGSILNSLNMSEHLGKLAIDYPDPYIIVINDFSYAKDRMLLLISIKVGPKSYQYGVQADDPENAIPQRGIEFFDTFVCFLFKMFSPLFRNGVAIKLKLETRKGDVLYNRMVNNAEAKKD